LRLGSVQRLIDASKEGVDAVLRRELRDLTRTRDPRLSGVECKGGT
jgi:hypothetical protein